MSCRPSDNKQPHKSSLESPLPSGISVPAGLSFVILGAAVQHELVATVGLGVSEFVYRIFGFSGFMSSMDWSFRSNMDWCSGMVIANEKEETVSF